MTVEDIAKVCHEANRAYCEAIGDHSHKPWSEAEAEYRESIVAGVRWWIEHTGASASAQHHAWMASKLYAGWKYGPVKDATKKEHPCIVPYEHLSPEHRAKDCLFVAVVRALAPWTNGNRSG